MDFLLRMDFSYLNISNAQSIILRVISVQMLGISDLIRKSLLKGLLNLVSDLIKIQMHNFGAISHLDSSLNLDCLSRR